MLGNNCRAPGHGRGEIRKHFTSQFYELSHSLGQMLDHQKSFHESNVTLTSVGTRMSPLKDLTFIPLPIVVSKDEAWILFFNLFLEGNINVWLPLERPPGITA